jgi:hypothetical protein
MYPGMKDMRLIFNTRAGGFSIFRPSKTFNSHLLGFNLITMRKEETNQKSGFMITDLPLYSSKTVKRTMGTPEDIKMHTSNIKRWTLLLGPNQRLVLPVPRILDNRGPIYFLKCQ